MARPEENSNKPSASIRICLKPIWGLAECLRRNNQTKDAIELYRKAIQISEEHYHSDKKAEEAARKQLDALGATP